MRSFNCNNSFTYVLHVLLFWIPLKDMKRAREKANTISTASCRYHQNRKNKTVIAGCGSFVVAYFQPATSTDYLHQYEKLGSDLW